MEHKGLFNGSRISWMDLLAVQPLPAFTISASCSTLVQRALSRVRPPPAYRVETHNEQTEGANPCSSSDIGTQRSN